MRLQECEEIMKVICDRLSVTPCNIIIHKYKCARLRQAHYNSKTKTIYLRAFSEPQPFHCVRRTTSLLHETAHHVTNCRFGPRENHGIRFVDALVEVVKAHYGEDNIDKYLWNTEYECVQRLYARLSPEFSRKYKGRVKASKQARLELHRAIKEALLKEGIPVESVAPSGRRTFQIHLAPDLPGDLHRELARKASAIAMEVVRKK